MRSSFAILLSIVMALFVLSPCMVAAQGSVRPSSSPAEMVRGRVTDENGQALAGVTVNIKGSGHSTTTDANGNYALAVPDKNATLVFSFVGSTPKEIVVGNQSRINTSLASTSTNLENVVVTALNIKKNPRSLVYSVVQLD